LQPPAAPRDAQDSKAPPPRALLWLLIAITSVAPMSLNIIMPALPGIVTTLQSDPTTVQLLLSLYLVCMALSQLVLGALSDRFGRRPVLIGGLLLTVVVSLLALFAASIAALVMARALQAFGASAGMVIGRAIIRDLYERDRAASMLATVTMVIMVVPTIVPPLGGFLQMTLGWQSIFATIALFAAVVLTWVWIALPETHTTPSGGGGLARPLGEFRILLTSRAFNGYVLAGSFSSALFFIFLGGAPHVISTLQGRSAFELGLWLTVASITYMMGNFCSARYSTRFGVDRMIAVGAVIGVLGGVAGLVLVLGYPHLGPIIIAVPQGITAFANGLVVPNGIAGAVSVRPQAAGTAAGIQGFVQMGIAAASAQWVSHLLAAQGTAAPMAWMLFAASVISLLAFVVLVWRPSRPQ
jgi:MFS transporter, DHA1 family, multidrug resistance protein